jgi:hypothetical protein
VETPHSTNARFGGAHYDRGRAALVVTDLVVTNAAVLRELPHWASGVRGAAADPVTLEGADLAPFCEAALAAGAMAISAAGGTQEAQHLDRLIAEVGSRTSAASEAAAKATTDATVRATEQMTKAAADAQRTINEAAAGAKRVFVEQVAESREQLSVQIGDLVGGDDPVLATKINALLLEFSAKLDHRVGVHTDELFAKATRSLDPRDPTSPMAAVQQQLNVQHQELAKRLGESQKDLGERLEKLSLEVHAATAASGARRQATLVTPLKGGVYAEQVHAQLEAFAVTQGDEYVDASNEVGRLPRCKKGDGVLTSAVGGATASIVIEMTDSDTAPRSWNEYLDEAERNRGALVSLGLVRTPEQLAGADRLRCYGPRRFVLAHDPSTDDLSLLHAVLLLLRGQAILAIGRVGNGDLRLAEGKLTEAVGCLERLAEVQKTAGSIRKGADKIDSDCAGLHTSLSRLLAEASAALGVATNDSAAA